MREIRQHPIEWFIKAFGVLSATAFISSGVANWALFSDLWGVNYFLIAGPSDVVMSAFAFASVFAISLIVSSVAVWLLYVFTSFLGRKVESVLRKLGAPQTASRQTGRWIIPVIHILLTLILAVIMLGVGIGQRRPIWYETGLKTAEGQQFGDKSCGGQRVAWLGSAAAIIDCQGTTVIIHKLDNLQTEPLDNARTAWLAPPNSPAVSQRVQFWRRVARP